MSITLVRNHLRHKNTIFRFLLCRSCFLTFFFLLFFVGGSYRTAAQQGYRLVFWNVENLFDIFDDPLVNDDAFTPAGENRWNAHRYAVKLSNISKTLVALGGRGGGRFEMPLLVGMAEVENDRVLRDLCRGTPLRRFNYGFVHFDSPDRRGIDNALLYRKGLFTPYGSRAVSVSDSAAGFFTRDILVVEGVTSLGDTIIAVVNHFPSKRGGVAADRRRVAVATQLRLLMDSLSAAHPRAALVVMGDYNGAPDEYELRGRLSHDASGRFVNLMEGVEPGRGSYKYRDHWSCLDQIIVSSNLTDKEETCPLRLVEPEGQVFEADFLMLDDEKFLGRKVFRTYLGMKYQGGYSDHLPVFVDLLRR